MKNLEKYLEIFADLKAEREDNDEIKEKIEELEYIVRSLKYMIEYLREDYNYVINSFYDHVHNGHLPPILSKEQMERALSALGLEKEYQVAPKIIYSRDKSGVKVKIG